MLKERREKIIRPIKNYFNSLDLKKRKELIKKLRKEIRLDCDGLRESRLQFRLLKEIIDNTNEVG